MSKIKLNNDLVDKVEKDLRLYSHNWTIDQEEYAIVKKFTVNITQKVWKEGKDEGFYKGLIIGFVICYVLIMISLKV